MNYLLRNFECHDTESVCRDQRDGPRLRDPLYFEVPRITTMSIWSDALVGFDDFFSSFDESLTDRRKIKLLKMKENAELLNDNFKVLYNTLQSFPFDMSMLGAAEAGRYDAFNRLFRLDVARSTSMSRTAGEEAVAGVKMLMEHSKSLVSSLGTGAKMMAWTLELSIEGSKVPGLQLAVFRASSLATKISGAKQALTEAQAAAKWTQWADKFDKVGTAIKGVIFLLQQVLVAISIAQMRQQSAKLADDITALKSNIDVVLADISAFTAEHRAFFSAYTRENEKSFTAGDDEHSTVTTEQFYENLHILARRVQDVGETSTIELRARASETVRQFHLLNHEMKARIARSVQDIAELAALLRTVAKDLRRGKSVEAVAAFKDLDTTLVTAVAEFTAKTPPEADDHIMLVIGDHGAISCVVSPS